MVYTPHLWAYSDIPIRILAVAGAAGLGYFLFGWITWAIVKLTTGQKLPQAVRYIINCLGGLVCGWVALLWLFGGGGGALGGPGGSALGGPGIGGTEYITTKKDKEPQTPDKQGKTDEPGIGEGQTIRIEVLGPEPLRKLSGKEKVEPSRLYRVVGMEGKLFDLDQVQTLLRQRRDLKPPLRRLEIVLYLDSPAQQVPHVANLARWARDLGSENDRFEVEFIERDRYAPVD